MFTDRNPGSLSSCFQSCIKLQIISWNDLEQLDMRMSEYEFLPPSPSVKSLNNVSGWKTGAIQVKKTKQRCFHSRTRSSSSPICFLLHPDTTSHLNALEVFLLLWTHLTQTISCCVLHIEKAKFEREKKKQPGPNWADVLQSSFPKTASERLSCFFWFWTHNVSKTTSPDLTCNWHKRQPECFFLYVLGVLLGGENTSEVWAFNIYQCGPEGPWPAPLTL